MNYTILSYAGQFTFGSLCLLMVLYGILDITDLLKNWGCAIIFYLLVCFELIYVFALDIATLMMNNSLENFLFVSKIGLLVL